jgi:hypothetical protein
MECSATCIGECLSYSWFRVRNLIHNEKVLRFDNLSRTDSGEYTCTVRDNYGTTSTSYRLDVQCRYIWSNDLLVYSLYGSSVFLSSAVCIPFSSITDGPSNVSITYTSYKNNLIEGRGYYVYLTCHADCNPTCSYGFYRNGQYKTLDYDGRIPVRKNRINSGRYSCSAGNSVADAPTNSSNSVDIYIQCK